LIQPAISATMRAWPEFGESDYGGWREADHRSSGKVHGLP
jgi:hypothetical protein